MSPKIHHLNCGTLCPYCQRLFNGGKWLKSGRLVCHCLLIEANDCLVLVDTGFGTKDIENSRKRLGSGFLLTARPLLTLEETAFHQIRNLGYQATDVRHIVPTHLDLDHAGGLNDFPDAHIHLHEQEYKSALNPRLIDQSRYRKSQLEPKANWKTYTDITDSWFGFDAIRILPELDIELLLIPLFGHTRGHTGVAVRQGDKWLLHCGDAYFHRAEIVKEGAMPVGLALFERMMSTWNQQRLDNQQRLRALADNHSDSVELFCAHDPFEFDANV